MRQKMDPVGMEVSTDDQSLQELLNGCSLQYSAETALVDPCFPGDEGQDLRQKAHREEGDYWLVARTPFQLLS